MIYGYIFYCMALYYSNGNKNYMKAIKYYEMAIKNGYMKAIYYLGNFYSEINDYPNAIKYYNLAIKNGDINAMCNLGYYYGEINDYSNAMKYYELAIKNNNNDSTVMFNLGICCDKLKDHLNAIKYYKMTIKNEYNAIIKKVYYIAIRNLIKIYDVTKQYEDMLTFFHEIKYEEEKIYAMQKILNLQTHVNDNAKKILLNCEIYDEIYNYKLNIFKYTLIIPQNNIDKYNQECKLLLMIAKSKLTKIPKYIIFKIMSCLFV
jgi:tetratricopeptide (TPR) repeat protein